MTNFVFLDGEEKPMTVRELSEETGVSRPILSVRAVRCKKKKQYQGQDCAVFTKDDLREPAFRDFKGEKKYIVRLNNGDVEELGEVEGKTEAQNKALDKVKKAIKPKFDGLSLWNAMVRKRNG